MKKIVWISFFSAIVIVNAMALAADYFGDVYIALPYRLVVILSITMISTVFGGAWKLMNAADEEVPSNLAEGRRPGEPQTPRSPGPPGHNPPEQK